MLSLATQRKHDVCRTAFFAVVLLSGFGAACAEDTYHLDWVDAEGDDVSLKSENGHLNVYCNGHMVVHDVRQAQARVDRIAFSGRPNRLVKTLRVDTQVSDMVVAERVHGLVEAHNRRTLAQPAQSGKLQQGAEAPSAVEWMGNEDINRFVQKSYQWTGEVEDISDDEYIYDDDDFDDEDYEDVYDNETDEEWDKLYIETDEEVDGQREVEHLSGMAMQHQPSQSGTQDHVLHLGRHTFCAVVLALTTCAVILAAELWQDPADAPATAAPALPPLPGQRTVAPRGLPTEWARRGGMEV